MATAGDARKSLGALGEQIAVDYLRRHGYVIRERNHRTPMGEIDIVAVDRKTLAFVEVRTRQGSAFGTAAESITARKQRKLVQLAESYLQSCPESFQGYRIDVVVVEFSSSSTLRRVELIKNAVEGS